MVCSDMLSRDSVLKSEGDSCILQRDMEQGRGVVCARCGDLVARARWAQHKQFWCAKATNLMAGDGIAEGDEGDEESEDGFASAREEDGDETEVAAAKNKKPLKMDELKALLRGEKI